MNEPRKVFCKTHGSVEPAFVCAHLVKYLQEGRADYIGLFQPERQDRDESERQGWCFECEQVRESEGGWNDRSEGFAQVTLVCSGCFETLERTQVHAAS